MNSFSEEHVIDNDGLGDLKVIDQLKLKTTTINKILADHWKPQFYFDLLSIDVEGLDLRDGRYARLRGRLLPAENSCNPEGLVREGAFD